MTIIFIGSQELAYAYALLGLETITTDNINNIKDLLRIYEEVIKREDVDVIVLEETLYRHLRENNIHKPGSLIKPILLVVPGLGGSEGYRLKELYDLISQAVGVRLELER